MNSTQQEEYSVRYNQGITGSIQITKSKLFKTINAFGIYRTIIYTLTKRVRKTKKNLTIC